MNWFWHAIWVALVVIPVTVLWIACLFDIVLRRDLGVAARVLWVLGILVVPFLGSLVYLLFRPPGAGTFGERASRSGSSLAQQLADLDRLRSTGAIDDREFQIAKEDALARVPTQHTANAGYPRRTTSSGTSR